MRRDSFVVLVMASSACDAAQQRNAPPPSASVEVSSDSAVAIARQLVRQSGAAEQVYLDSVQVVRVDSLWRVAFRRTHMAAPFQMTIDVNARTGVPRFLGDE
jgi:hypothetical protein